jgi:hypothetical protein
MSPPMSTPCCSHARCGSALQPAYRCVNGVCWDPARTLSTIYEPSYPRPSRACMCEMSSDIPSSVRAEGPHMLQLHLDSVEGAPCIAPRAPMPASCLSSERRNAWRVFRPQRRHRLHWLPVRLHQPSTETLTGFKILSHRFAANTSNLPHACVWRRHREADHHAGA